MPASASSFTTTLTQQPWSLWWLQGQRLTLIELRRNLFAWRAAWIYLLAFIPAFSGLYRPRACSRFDWWAGSQGASGPRRASTGSSPRRSASM